jgi:hypothetical protein
VLRYHLVWLGSIAALLLPSRPQTCLQPTTQTRCALSEAVSYHIWLGPRRGQRFVRPTCSCKSTWVMNAHR